MSSPSSSATTVPPRRSETLRNEALNPSFADLPSSLLEAIMSQLVLKDNIRASAACKSWREAAVSVRVVEKRPWLMCFPLHGSLFEFRDPLQWKLYTLNLPELDNSTLHYSRDGWLLMRRWICSVEEKVFLFNPFSRELISLPKFEGLSYEMAFSCPPTSDHCVVVALKCDARNHVTINTWHPGATEWITTDFPTDFNPYQRHSRLVYVNDRFYLFTEEGLYYFDPFSRKWDSHNECTLKRCHIRGCKEVYLAEKKGELFAVCTYETHKPMVYKLVSLKWEEMSDTELDGLTFFVSNYSYEVRTDLPWIRNNLYFSRYNRMRCVSFSFDERICNLFDQGKNRLITHPLDTIWIDLPNNVLYIDN